MKSSAFVVAAVCAAAVLLPRPASSQPPDPQTERPGEPPQTEQAPPSQQPPIRHLTPSWQDGLVLESDDGDYRLQFGTFLRFDGRFVPNEPQVGIPDTLLMRTLRLTFQGRIARYFTFRLQPDFVSKDSTVADAWADVAFSDAVHLRVGRDKVPIGIEVLFQDSNVLFLERGLTVNLLPQRDVGAQFYGTLLRGAVEYQSGIFNGQVDGASNSANNADTDNAKDLVGRVLVHPFSRFHARPLERLSIGVGGSSGRQQNAPVPTFRTSVQQTYFLYAKDVVANGDRTRIAPQMSYYEGTFGMYGEYVRSHQRVARGTDMLDSTNTAWQLAGSVLLTGETAGERIRPRRAFDPARHHWGAIQLAARYGVLRTDPNAFARGFADSAASRQVQVVTAGANWYLTTNVKVMLNLERSIFDKAAADARHTENAALFRVQLNY